MKVPDINMMKRNLLNKSVLCNKEVEEIGYTFEAHIHKQGQITVEARRYIDISYVNYWTDKQQNHIYRVYMRNGEALNVDNEKFNVEHCPRGVNTINEVTKKEYL